MTTENLDGGQEPTRMDGWNLANYLDLSRSFAARLESKMTTGLLDNKLCVDFVK